MLQPKKPVKKYIPTAKEKKNLEDATQMKNMRPTGPSTGRVKPTMGKAKNGKTIKKAQNGTSEKGNTKGYKTSTSPMKTGPYEKRLDTIGGGSTKSVRMLSGKGDVMGQERLGSAGAAKLKKTYEREKAYTDERRKYNREFLESREATGKAATKSMKKAKCGTKMKKK